MKRLLLFLWSFFFGFQDFLRIEGGGGGGGDASVGI